MKKISYIHTIPAALSVSIGLIAIKVLHNSSITEVLETPFAKGSDLSALIYNIAFFILIVLAGTSILVLLIKLNKIRILPALYALSIFFSEFIILEIYLLAIYEKVPQFNPLFIDFLSFFITLFTVILILKPFNELLLAFLLIFYGALAGTLFTELLPFWSIIGIAITLAFYDIYAVFKGPLRYVIEKTYISGEKHVMSPENPLRGAVISLKGLSIGLGDILIYSMLSSTYYIFPYPSLSRWVITATVIVLGHYFTLKLLEKKRYLPALPLPVLLSIMVFVIFMNLS